MKGSGKSKSGNKSTSKKKDIKEREREIVNFDEYLNILLKSIKEDDEKFEPIKNSKKFQSNKNQKSSMHLEKYEWKRIDDIQLIELIEKYNFDWKKIALIMDKPENLIKNRYEKRLNPKLKFSKFTPEEDSLIIKKYKIYGSQWNQISQFLPNRSSIMIKNRFYSNLKKKLNDEEFALTPNANSDINHIPYNRSNDLLSLDAFEKENAHTINNINTNLNYVNNPMKKLMENSNSYLNDSNYYNENIQDNQSGSFPLNDSKIKPLSYSDNSVSCNPLIEEEKLDLNEINNNLENFFFENEESLDNDSNLSCMRNLQIRNNQNTKKLNINDFINKNNIINNNNFRYDLKNEKQNDLNSKANIISYQRENDSNKNKFSLFTTTNTIKTPSEYVIKEIKDISSYNITNNINYQNQNINYIDQELNKNLNNDNSPKEISYPYFWKNSNIEKDKYIFENIKENNKSNYDKDKMELDEINIFTNLNQKNDCFESDEDEGSLYTNSCHNHCASSSKSEIFINDSLSNSNYNKELNVNEISNTYTQNNNSGEEGKLLNLFKFRNNVCNKQNK